MGSRKLRIALIAAAAVLAVILAARVGVVFYTDILWYDEVGYLGTYWTRFWLGIGVRAAAAAVGAGILFVNLFVVARHIGAVRVRRRYGNIEIAEQIPRRHVTLLTVLIAVLGGWWMAELQFGSAATLGAASWIMRVPWGVTDPVFGNDIAFYVFTLPFLLNVLGFLMLVVVWSAVLVGLGHVLGGGIRLDGNRVSLARPARLHLSTLGASLLVLLGIRYWLGVYLLVVEGNGVGGGIGYTDVQARIPGYRAMTLLFLVAAGSVLYGAWRRSLMPPVLGVGALIAGGVLLTGAYPAVVQRFQVEPNELSREAPYIRWHMDFTLQAYGLEDIRRQPFPYRREAAPDPERLDPLFRTLPLWDTEPLQRAFNAVQSLFQYYWFPDADFDRYGPPGEERQVVVAVREFQPEGLEPQSRTWQSLHLNPTYIRGRGAVVAPAHPTSEGRGTHELWMGNIEPVEIHLAAPALLRLDQSSVFYGETMGGYVVVIPGRDGQFTGQAGFDYPRGIPLTSFLRVAAFAWRFADETLLFAREITPDSRLVFRRPVRERVREVAPFIFWDEDPVPVIFEGRIVWLLDGYTMSGTFPLARPLTIGRVRTRYLRNSVKAAVDAVTGTVAFYSLDAEDPVLATYGRVFPELFQPLESMPEGLRRHLRYPELALLARSEILQEYHLERVEAFYAGQNVWQRPQQSAPGGGMRAYRPVVSLMPVPGEPGVEYVGVLPYIARGRQNMTALLMVRNDEVGYGDLTLLEFPRDQQVPGPAQVQAMIEQDPVIAPELSLLRQRGSHIDMGKLRVVPLDSTVIYVQPLFLSADENPIPEIWGIVASDGRGISLGRSLQAAVAGLGQRPQPPVTPTTGEGAGPDRGEPAIQPPGRDVGVWPREALEVLERADARLRAGDWAGYGRAMDELRQLLLQANRQGGSPEA
jgi:uncharacterized protein